MNLLRSWKISYQIEIACLGLYIDLLRSEKILKDLSRSHDILGDRTIMEISVEISQNLLIFTQVLRVKFVLFFVYQIYKFKMFKPYHKNDVKSFSNLSGIAVKIELSNRQLFKTISIPRRIINGDTWRKMPRPCHKLELSRNARYIINRVVMAVPGPTDAPL